MPHAGPPADGISPVPVRAPLVVRAVAGWWTLRAAPEPAGARGNIGTAGWRPRAAALAVGLPGLAAAALLAPWLVRALSGAGVPAWGAAYAAWALCLTVVFAYVAGVTTGRAGNPLRGRHGGWRDLAAVHAAGAVLFLAAAAPAGASLPGRSAGEHALHFALPLLIGAHVSYAEKLPLGMGRSINAANWRADGAARRAWALARLAVLAGGAGWLLAVGGGWRAAAACAAVLALLGWITREVRPAGFHPYVHHWAAFLAVALLSAGSLPVLAFAAAGFVEGAARWSCAPLWHPEGG